MERLAWRAASLLHAHDLVTLEHARRVATYCSIAGHPELWHAALCHDIGKYAIAPRTLHAHRPLTRAEWEGTPGRVGMRQHPQWGHDFLRQLAGHRRVPRVVYDVCRHHHEHWDGTGYPCGLAGERIPWAARLVGLLDAYDAMTYLRAYRGIAYTPERAIRELEQGAGSQFDPALVAAVVPLLRCFGTLPQYDALTGRGDARTRADRQAS